MTDTPGDPLVVQLDERRLDQGRPVLYLDRGALIRLAFDPRQIGEGAALDLLQILIPRAHHAIVHRRRA